MNSYYGKLTAGTTYKYRFYVVNSSNKYFYSGTYSFRTTPAVVNPSISVKSVSGLTSNDARINATVNNPSRLKITKCGFILYDNNNKTLASKYDSINYTYASFNAWFNLNSYYGKLTANTTYRYRFYIMTSQGQYVYSPVCSFTTAKATAPSSYTNKINAFISDARWKNGVSWNGYQTPKLSGYSSKGCCAYTSDFAAYVWGKSSFRDGIKYSGTANIKAGDIIYVTKETNTSFNQHWFVVLERNGNTLKTAEGNCSYKVRISSTAYTVSGIAGSYTTFTGYHMP